MADESTPQQIQDLADALERYKKSQQTLEDAQKEYGKTLGRSAVQLTKSLYDGSKGVTQFSDALESVAAATAAFTAALAVFKPALLVVAKVAAGFAVFTKAIGAAAKQGDALFKTYQDLGRVGSTAADGISGVFDNMQKFGYGIEELDKMVALVAENSKTLATFSLTAADGARAFADGMAQIQRDQQLRTLGKTTEDINAAGAAFIRQQTMMGRRQFDVQGQLGDRTRAYILELDRLQRLTGRSADELQKQQEELLARDEYAFYMRSLEQQGEAGRAQAQKMREVTAFFPEYSDLIAQAIGGNLEAAQQLNFIAPSLIKNLRDPLMSTNQVIMQFEKEGVRAAERFGPLAGLYSGATRDVIGPLNQLYTATSRAADITERTTAAERQRLISDPATKNLALASIANMNSRDALQSMVKLGVAPATAALVKLAGAAETLTTGGATAMNAPGMGGQRGAFSYDRARAAAGRTNQQLLDIIGRGESGGNYNALVYGKGGARVPTSANLTGMTIAQVQEYQKGMIERGHASTAVGKYQMIASTLAEQVKKLGLDPNVTLFDEKTQDRLAQQLINQAGVGRVDTATAMRNLAGTWASLPMDMSGRGRYDGFNANRVSIDPKELVTAINTSGPVGSYRRSLSSTTVDSSANASANTQTSQQTTMNSQLGEFFGQMLDKLDNLNRVQREQRDLQQKQLQVSS